MEIRIGHSAYTGRNSMKLHDGYQSALNDLLSRGVKMAEAHTKMKSAIAGTFTVARAGRLGHDVVEIAVI